MVETSRLLSKLAGEVVHKYGTPTLIFRGSVFRISIDGPRLVPTKFLGYIGTSSTFAILPDDDYGYTVCSVRIIDEPQVFRLKIRSAGLIEILECVDSSRRET
ncbi:MAG: hypothetical protein J7L12_04920 [Desulfurococcales archaeon]|nr:hypothetical protein [Desulfurococcales archaeon]